MGEMADYYLEQDMERHLSEYFDTEDQDNIYKIAENRFDKDRWTMRNGDTIVVKEMSTSHLQNTVAFLKLKPKDHCLGRRDGWIEKFIEELTRRGKPIIHRRKISSGN